MVLLLTTATALPQAIASRNIALVLAHGPCDHGAIGDCALRLAPCPSCGATDATRKCATFPISPKRSVNDHLHCAECWADAGHLDEAQECEGYEPDWDLIAKDEGMGQQ